MGRDGDSSASGSGDRGGHASAVTVHGPVAEIVAALGRPAGGPTVRWSVRPVDDRAKLSEALRSPVDLVVVWEGRGEPGAVETVETVLAGPLRPPVVAVLPRRRAGDGIRLVEQGVHDYLFDDHLERLAVVARDVLERGRLDALPEMTRSTCHELNNLLAPIPLAAGLLRPGLTGADLQVLEDLDRSAGRATRLVDTLYREALRCADPEPAALETSDPAAVVEVAARALRDAFPGAVVETDRPTSEPITAAGAFREVLRLVLCLCWDALERCAGGAPLCLSADARPDGLVAITVSCAAPPPEAALPTEVAAAAQRLGGRIESGDEGGSGWSRLVLPRPSGLTPPGPA